MTTARAARPPAPRPSATAPRWPPPTKLDLRRGRRTTRRGTPRCAVAALQLQALRRWYHSAFPHPGLSWSVDERSLTDAFSSFGTVTEDGARDRCSTRCRGGREPLHREVFDEMPVRDIVACSAAIYRHARSGSFHQSVGLFVGMTRDGVCPNSFTLVGVLLAAAGLGDTVLAKCIHGWAVKRRLESNPFVATALVDAYAKCGCPLDAWTIFSYLTDPSVVSWNAMISGLMHNGLFERALLVFKRLCCCFGLVPNNVVTMINVAQAYAGCGDLLMCKSAHAYAVKFGLDLNVSATNSIVGMYLSFGDIEIGREIFRKIIVHDVVTWTMMMGFLLELAHASEVISLFVQMRSDAIVPDRVAMVSLVQACALLGDARRGKLVHNQMVIRGFSRVPAVNSLITMYSKCKDLSSARVLFDRTREKSSISWTAMVSGYLGSGNVLEGMHLFSKMRREGIFVIDSVTLVSLLIGCYEVARFELCVQLHGYSYKSGLYMHRPVPNTLMAVYGKCGYATLAHKVFDDMISRDVVSWNTMILSYGINGQGRQAIALFNDMEESSEERDSVTYLNTMLACSHSGLVDDGLIVFRKMINENRINPCQEHIGCLVDMLARAGRLDEAAEVASLTNKVGSNSWKALMGGGYLHNDTELTEVAAEKVLKMKSIDYGHVVLLSNTYASAGKYTIAESIRSCYSNRTKKKTLGLSSIEAMPSSTR